MLEMVENWRPHQGEYTKITIKSPLMKIELKKKCNMNI